MAMTTFEKGVQAGFLQGQRTMLQKPLEVRFGPLSPSAQERLESLSPERLEALTLELLKRSRSRNWAWRIEPRRGSVASPVPRTPARGWCLRLAMPLLRLPYQEVLAQAR